MPGLRGLLRSSDLRRPLRAAWRNALVSFLLSLLYAPRPLRAQPVEALWYSVRNEASVQSFLRNADRISIVSPQVFGMDSAGIITGSLDARLVARARAAGVKLVPLVMNPGFDLRTLHVVLTNPVARRRAMRSLSALCRNEKLDGIQFDFENIHISDRDAFTAFAREAVDTLHRVGCTLSAAVVPRVNDAPGPTAYRKWIYDYWRGAYDYKALADTLDFISYMTYAQHTGGSTDGPVGGYPWIEASLKYVLAQGVPPRKISLGIPGYSDWWFPDYSEKNGARMRGHDVSYDTVTAIVKRTGGTLLWDDVQKAWHADWDVGGVFEHAWVEDKRAFLAKLALVQQYKLRGYSVWVLGLEDPSTWEALPPQPWSSRPSSRGTEPSRPARATTPPR